MSGVALPLTSRFRVVIGPYVIALRSYDGSDAEIVHRLCEEYGVIPSNWMVLPCEIPDTLADLLDLFSVGSGHLVLTINGFALGPFLKISKIVLDKPKDIINFAPKVEQLNLFAYED